jgi:hypothetical protein
MSPDRHGSGATRIEADLSIKRGEKLMRRASTCLAVLGFALLALPGVASAAPEVTFKATAVPIAGFPHTGNIKGAGAAVQAEYSISGTEYGGFPPPLVGLNFYLPSGAKLHTSGFKTCTEATLKNLGPKKCPKGSQAGPVGKVLGIVAFGKERVQENATLESFFAPRGGLLFYTEGNTPVQLEILSTGKYTALGGGGGFGPKLIASVPLVETVPGAPDASVEKISVKVGTAIKKGKQTIYYGTMPKTCPKKHLQVKTELTFAALGGLETQTVTKTYNAPCPR